MLCVAVQSVDEDVYCGGRGVGSLCNTSENVLFNYTSKNLRLGG